MVGIVSLWERRPNAGPPGKPWPAITRRGWVSSSNTSRFAIDRYRAGEVDAYTVDETIHHYHRAARELWKFCWSGSGGTHTEMVAHVLDRMTTDGETINWWERVSPRQPD